MARSPFSPDQLDRRQFLGTSAAAAGLSMVPGLLGAQTAPWAERPAGTPSQVTFVVWQYGKIYEQIARQFEQDWSVKINQIIEPNVEPQVAKLTAMYAAGDPVDEVLDGALADDGRVGPAGVSSRDADLLHEQIDVLEGDLEGAKLPVELRLHVPVGGHDLRAVGLEDLRRLEGLLGLAAQVVADHPVRERVAGEAEPDGRPLEGAGEVAGDLVLRHVVAGEDGEPWGAGAGDEERRRARRRILPRGKQRGGVLLVRVPDEDL